MRQIKFRGKTDQGKYTTEIIWKNIGFTLKENKTYFIDFVPSLLTNSVIIGNIYEIQDNK